MRKVFDAWLNLTQQALVDSISQVAEQTAIKATSLPPQSAVPPRQPTGVPEFMRQWPARMIAPTPPKETPNTRTSQKEEYESFTTSLPTPKVQQAPAHPPPPAASPPVKEAAATSVDPKKEMPSPLGGEIKVQCYFTCGHYVCNWYNRGGKWEERYGCDVSVHVAPWQPVLCCVYFPVYSFSTSSPLQRYQRRSSLVKMSNADVSV